MEQQLFVPIACVDDVINLHLIRDWFDTMPRDISPYWEWDAHNMRSKNSMAVLWWVNLGSALGKFNKNRMLGIRALRSVTVMLTEMKRVNREICFQENTSHLTHVFLPPPNKHHNFIIIQHEEHLLMIQWRHRRACGFIYRCMCILLRINCFITFTLWNVPVEDTFSRIYWLSSKISYVSRLGYFLTGLSGLVDFHARVAALSRKHMGVFVCLLLYYIRLKAKLVYFFMIYKDKELFISIFIWWTKF